MTRRPPGRLQSGVMPSARQLVGAAGQPQPALGPPSGYFLAWPWVSARFFNPRLDRPPRTLRDPLRTSELRETLPAIGFALRRGQAALQA